MTDMQSVASGGSSATLSTDGSPPPEPAPEDTSGVEDQWSAVINCHDCTTEQIEMAVASNGYTLDPHPTDPTRRVRRHPIYLVAVDYSQIDAEGRPSPGKPLDMDLAALRDIFSTRYPFISAEALPSDGSQVHLMGARIISLLDSAGNPTGAVQVAQETEA